MTETLTFDREEALVRGQIPLKEFKEILKQQDETKITTIDFSRNGYCNDAVLKLIKSEKKKKYENLKKVCLDGCVLISNAGIKWLSDIIDGATQLKQIVLDGCINLSDDELSLLLKIVGSNCEVQMRGTSVCYLYSPEGKTIQTLGCPLITGMKSNEEAKFGHALVIPHDSVENSFAELVKTKKPSKRKPFHHVTDLDLNDWSIAISEMSIKHPMFDSMINNHQTAVIIPFDESAVIQEVKKHITDTIAKVVTKTAFTTEYLQNKVEEVKKVRVDMEVDDFMTVQNVCKQHFHGDILGNISYKNEFHGCLLSGTPLTRSNPYFEAELVEAKVLTDDGNVDSVKVVDPSEDSDDDDDDERESEVFIGCLFNKYLSCLNPLEVIDDDIDGHKSSRFDLGISKTFGFGIKGEWVSEYIPSSKASFFASRNGLEDNEELNSATVIEGTMYPVIAVVGGKYTASKIRLLNLAKPPEELTKKWEKENRWITMGHIDNLLVDNNGIMCNSSQNEDEGVFISQDDIDKEFTIKVLDKGNFGKIRIALSKEKEQDKEIQKQESWIYQGVTGEVVSEKKTKYLVSPSHVETGDVLTVKFVTEDKEEKVVLFKNEQKIAETPFKTPKDNDMSILKLYIYISETRCQVQLINYRPRYRGPVLFPNSLTVGRLHNLKILDDGMLIAEIPENIEDKFYGCYMGKSPMNSECLSFEIMIEETLTKEVDAVAIGFCHSEIPQKLQTIESILSYSDLETVFEICGGCVVFSSRGNVYAESQIPGACKDDGQYNKGDKVKCEVEKSPSADKLLFDEDGSISPQQDVNIKFYVNDKMVHEYAMTLKSDGLFPTVFTNAEIDEVAMLKILNFYPETAENRKKANMEQKVNKKKKVNKQEKVEKTKNEQCPVFRDCEFLVVEIGKTAGKLQLVEEQLKGDMFTSTIENINKSIDYHEKNFRDLDIHGQTVYSTLCQAKEKIESLVQKPSRIKYMSMDITTGQGLDKVVEKLTDILDCRLKHQEIKYNLSKKTHGHMATVMDTVKQQKIIEFGSGLVGFEEKVLKLNGREFLQIAKLLHEQV